MRHLLAALLVLAASTAVAQDKEKLSSDDLEVRTFLAFKASDAVAQKNLPPGWELNSPAAGPSKGFNLGMTLINQTITQGPDGKALHARTYIAFFAPAKKTGTDDAGPMVLIGFMGQDGAPGAYGAYEPAKVTVERRQRTEADGKTSIEETWEAKADDGSVLEIEVQFVRGMPARDKGDVKVYSAPKPGFYRIYRFEQAADVARSTATGIDRVSKFSIKATGPKLSPLFDGSQQLISVTSIPYYARSIYLPVF
jgi:hypothetical protein